MLPGYRAYSQYHIVGVGGKDVNKFIAARFVCVIERIGARIAMKNVNFRMTKKAEIQMMLCSLMAVSMTNIESTSSRVGIEMT